MNQSDSSYAVLSIKLKNSPDVIKKELTIEEFRKLSESKERTMDVMHSNGISTIKTIKKFFPELSKIEIEEVLFSIDFSDSFIPNHHIATRERIEKCVSVVCGVDLDFVKDKESFTDDLDMDSLDYVELMLDLEHEFDLDIPDEEVSDIKTITQAVSYLKER